MMKMKRWMMTALLSVMALFAVSVNPVEREEPQDTLAQKNGTMGSMKNDLVNAGKGVLERVKAFISFLPEQEKIKSAPKETLWLAAQHKTLGSAGPIPVHLPVAAELPQPIRKISGVLIHANQESISKILQMREYRSSG